MYDSWRIKKWCFSFAFEQCNTLTNILKFTSPSELMNSFQVGLLTTYMLWFLQALFSCQQYVYLVAWEYKN